MTPPHTVVRMAALQIEPVVEVVGDAEFDLWPVVGRDGFWYLALHGDLTEREVGTALHQVLRWFHTDEQGIGVATVDDYLARALAPRGADDVRPMAMGGMRFTDTATGVTILPGCCYSIDERSEIVDVLDGRRPGCWFGHDPDAGFAIRDGVVEITQDAEDLDQPVLRFAPDEVRTALARAETDLRRFCDCVATWAARHVPKHAHTLPEAVARALEVGWHGDLGGGSGPFDASA